MEIIANFKTKVYEFDLIDEKNRRQKIKQGETDKEYFLIVSDVDLVKRLSTLESQYDDPLDILESSGVDVDEMV